MTTINEIQLILQNLLKKTISQTEIGKALGTGRSNINLRIKNKSKINLEEIEKLNTYFQINLTEVLNNRYIKDNHSYNIEKDAYKEIIKILNSSTEKELEFYYGIIKQCQKSVNLLKNEN